MGIVRVEGKAPPGIRSTQVPLAEVVLVFCWMSWQESVHQPIRLISVWQPTANDPLIQRSSACRRCAQRVGWRFGISQGSFLMVPTHTGTGVCHSGPRAEPPTMRLALRKETLRL